jgi:type IV secretion system protein VirB10
MGKSGFSLGLLAMLCLLTACGKKAEEAPPPPPPSQSSVDDLLNSLKNQPPPPAEIGRIVAAPSTIDFGFVQPGTPQTATIMLSNSGDQDITVSNITLASNPDVFTLGGSCRAGFNLTKIQSCEISVTFTPTQAQNYGTQILVAHSAEGSPLFLPVSGIAANAPEPLQVLQPLPMAPDPLAENAYKIAQTRSQSKLLTLPAEPSVSGAGRLRSLDPSYEALGFAATTSSLPVDRSRMITADRYIPAVLENSISTVVPTGRAMAVIENHVYSSDNRFILLPAGTRVVGSYSGGTSQGDSRLQINWSRMIRPDGSSLRVGFASGDVAGRDGIPGYVDNRLWDKYGVPLLLSAINAAFVYAAAPESTVTSSSTTGTTTTQTLTPGDLAFQQFSSDLSSLVNQIIQSNVDLRPIITVPGGTRLTIIPTQDLVMATPQLLTAEGTEVPLDVAEQRRQLLLGANSPFNKQTPLQFRQPRIDGGAGDDEQATSSQMNGQAPGYTSPLAAGSIAPSPSFPANLPPTNFPATNPTAPVAIAPLGSPAANAADQPQPAAPTSLLP